MLMMTQLKDQNIAKVKCQISKGGLGKQKNYFKLNPMDNIGFLYL